MLKRKKYDELLEWKNKKDKECLLIKGARQVGKTFLVEQFGKKEYKSFIEINFIKEPSCREIFEETLEPEDIYKRISMLKPNSKFIENDTLIFLDEIQMCAMARTSLKFLAEDNRYDVIASGSLLGLHYGMDADKEVEEVQSIPVGYETQMTMYSMDFEEFLWAKGYFNENIVMLKECFVRGEKIPKSINDKFENLFREYMVVGGMPEVVQAFVNTGNFGEVKRKQNKILSAYDDDIANHAKKTERPKIRACYKSIPSQLARENKKFSYATVERGAGSKKYGDSITWIRDANLVNICFNVREPQIPLIGNQNNGSFKLYVNDTGLLMAMYGDSAKKSLIMNAMKGNVKGGIYENVIAELLIKKGYELHFYSTVNNSQEIEFIVEKETEVIPIEVKAGNTSTLSLNNYIKNFKPTIAYKFINGNIGRDGEKYTLPHYMIMFI